MASKGSSFTRAADTEFGREFERRAREQLRPPTRAERRLIELAADADGDAARSILYQHSVLCQTILPYRNPGDTTRTWERQNGHVHLEICAGKAFHPTLKTLVPLGLPYGPKARLVLMQINKLALLQRSPVIEVDRSLTRFIGRTLQLDTGGRTIGTVKEQLARLAAASIRLGFFKDGQARTLQSHLVHAFDVWFTKDPRQRILWPSTIELSLDYWESLKAHGVPLDEGHIRALSHSGLALDIYAWLAQRLHRVPIAQPALIAWPVLQAQFGADYARLDNFRPVFRSSLQQVLAVYQGARVHLERRGIILRHSRPAVLPRLQAVGGQLCGNNELSTGTLQEESRADCRQTAPKTTGTLQDNPIDKNL